MLVELAKIVAHVALATSTRAGRARPDGTTPADAPPERPVRVVEIAVRVVLAVAGAALLFVGGLVMLGSYLEISGASPRTPDDPWQTLLLGAGCCVLPGAVAMGLALGLGRRKRAAAAAPSPTTTIEATGPRATDEGYRTRKPPPSSPG